MSNFSQSLILISRDVLKEVIRLIIQIKTRFIIEREKRTWIHISTRLDVIPRNKNHSKNSLKLKEGAFIESGCVVNTWHGNVFFGENSHIGINTIVIGPASIHNNVHIAQNCFISGENHNYKDISQLLENRGFDIRPVTINQHVWIGANCTVLPGIIIGEHSVVGAGSVVTKDIPPFSVVVGNPARVIKKYNHDKKEWIENLTT